MLTWLLLASLFCTSTQDGNGHDTGVFRCEPHDLTLTKSGQMLLLSWKDDPSCPAGNDTLVYDLVVLRADKQVHEDEVTVTPDTMGSTHHWNWTSDLPLECFSYSVRLRSRYKNQKSQWEIKETLPGKGGEVYPQDKVFKISNQTYALTVSLNQPTKRSCTDVKCVGNKSPFGACAYVGYPPGDRDLQCETQDFESVRCNWAVGKHPRLPRIPINYHLNGRPCKTEGTCEQKIQDGERKWILTANNSLGKVELTDHVDISERVRMFPPKDVNVLNVNARNVSLQWGWTVPHYNNVNITCQVKVSHGGTHVTKEERGVGLNYTVVKDLIPDWEYTAAVRCGTTQHFWKWSHWSTSESFHTKGDVPDALDVWMQMSDSQVIIVWKMPLANQSNGHITGYTVTWAKTTERHRQNTITVAPSVHHLPLNLDPTAEYTVTVTARNMNGSSSPSALTIPRRNTGRAKVTTTLITGSNGSFSLSWSASPIASCGYIVDWCPTSGQCKVEWLRLPPHEMKARIFSKNFKDGVRYSLSIYACTYGPPVLLEGREGYVTEQKMNTSLFEQLEWKQQGSGVKLSWRSIPLAEQTAFIQGYVLYWLDNTNKDNNGFVNSARPEATSIMAERLKISSYTFTLYAQTAVGPCGAAEITVTLNSLSDNLIETVSISLVSVFFLFSLVTVMCYRNWGCIKRKVYPPIPKPVLTDKWLTPQNEPICHSFYVDPNHKSEADILDVPELHFKSVSPATGGDSQKNMPYICERTPKDYYNRPLKKNPPPPLSLPTASIPSQSRLPPSTFTGMFPNLSYNLITQTGDQQSNSEPQDEEETSLEGSCSGYQPQSHSESLNQIEDIPDSPLSCVSSYILLP
ncbi:hypothetical protein Q5P01_024359 [Channa striata]|uniref:Fibronectin type-III domain-containing protein n=1 Tax=Channa striata TaxID=64152 RepID=A0AA88IL87_CHASR|nr:hypothetical protein Q5P01_024359 [Channa striata]